MSPYVWRWLDSLHRRSQVWFWSAQLRSPLHLPSYLPSPGGKRPKHVKPSGVDTNSFSGVKNICSFSLLFPLSRSPKVAALQGTSCGKSRHCIGGLCVPKTLPLGGDGSSGETFWESFSAGTRRTSTSTTASSVETSDVSTSEPGRVVYFPKTFDICQFFAQFGITLNDICQRWHTIKGGHPIISYPVTLSIDIAVYVVLIKHIQLL